MSAIVVDDVAAEVRRTIRAEMARRGISQTELGAHLGLVHSAISKRLSGRVDWSLRELIRVADLFGLEVSELTRPTL